MWCAGVVPRPCMLLESFSAAAVCFLGLLDGAWHTGDSSSRAAAARAALPCRFAAHTPTPRAMATARPLRCQP